MFDLNPLNTSATMVLKMTIIFAALIRDTITGTKCVSATLFKYFVSVY
jgi:hypothetical protein